ncbi:hypothetical protein FQN55_002289 [Onygenales sp. PD_40]|nr:hypothetical protein FQN55_002289 [Onygenales sp. PD_40]KAK2786661.1 hypothetical protein FQN53_006365 [Emmonsiellopsis sp. PD_33]
MASPQAGPELEFGDPMRQALLEEIESVAKSGGRSEFIVPPDVWSALWLSDFERLQELKSTRPGILRWVLRNQRKRPQSRMSSAARSRNSSPGRSVNPRQNRVSSIRDEEVADVIERPESRPTSHPRPKRSEHQKSLKAAVFTENKTEVCHNLITLAPHVHACWERALFALKPLDIAEDQKTMRPMATRPELPASLDGDMTNLKFFDCETEEKIHSGTILTLDTDYPVTKPLPSTALLEMQWILHRLTALSGAADIFLSESDWHDDSSDVSLDLDVSDESSLREGD